jgi:phage RecT family recombinase
MATPTKALTVSEYMRQPEQLARFTDLLGKDGQAYVQSVLIVVGSDDKLRECTPQSVFKTALRAASLGLSCDPALKQAWIVPYNKKVKTKSGDTWVKEAQFQPHYKGLYTLAMRTGKYWTINVSPVYEGQRVLENPLTGLHVVREDNGFVGQPQSYNSAYVDVTVRRKKEMKVIGWIGYFKTKRGAEKSVWMSCAEIEDHARKYVKDYEKNPNWNDLEKRPVMEMKTVFRQLASWMDLSGSENEKIVQALQAETVQEDPIDAQAEDLTGEVTPIADLHPITIEEARQTIAVIAGKEKPLGECLADELNWVYVNSIKNNVVEAAKIVLREDFRMEPPQDSPKKSKDQLQKELGF